MLSLFPHSGRKVTERPQITRRDAMKLGVMGSAGLSSFAFQSAHASTQQTHSATAKRCIYIFLCGGPSQLDMWDLKPNAPDSIRGPFHPIATSVPGLQIGDLLPLTAKHADRFAVVRSMMHSLTSLNAIRYTSPSVGLPTPTGRRGSYETV